MPFQQMNSITVQLLLVEFMNYYTLIWFHKEPIKETNHENGLETY